MGGPERNQVRSSEVRGVRMRVHGVVAERKLLRTRMLHCLVYCFMYPARGTMGNWEKGPREMPKATRLWDPVPWVQAAP